jgi:hypothetical protein
MVILRLVQAVLPQSAVMNNRFILSGIAMCWTCPLGKLWFLFIYDTVDAAIALAGSGAPTLLENDPDFSAPRSSSSKPFPRTGLDTADGIMEVTNATRIGRLLLAKR